MSLRLALDDVRRCLPSLHSIATSLRQHLVRVEIPGSLYYTADHNASRSQSATRPTLVKSGLGSTNLDRLIWRLQVASKGTGFNSVQRAYQDFLDDELRYPTASYITRPPQNRILLSSLSELAVHSVELTTKVLELLYVRCRIPIDAKVHGEIIAKLHASGETHSAFYWLTGMKRKAGNVLATPELWKTFLQKCQWDTLPLEFFKSPASHVRMSGCQPNGETYAAILKTLLADRSKIPPRDIVGDVLQEMEKAGFISTAIVDSLPDNYTMTILYDAVPQLRNAPLRIHGDQKSQADNVNAELLATLLRGGEEEAIMLFQDWVKMGFRPSPATLAAVAGGITTIQSLTLWEKLTGVDADDAVWKSVICNAGTKQAVLETYRACIDRGFIPKPTTVLSVFQAILRSPTTSNIDLAIDMLRQYVLLTAPIHNPSLSGSRNPSHDFPLYEILLHAIATASSTTTSLRIKYLPTVCSLLEEMHERDISISSAARASIIVQAMQCAFSAEEALNLYSLMKQSKTEKEVLNVNGFITVLDNFTTKFFKDPPSFPLCMTIVKDMRDAGYGVPIQVFTILLRQLGLMAGRVRQIDLKTNQLSAEDLMSWDQLVHVVRAVHNHISVEHSLRPDTTLWNQLMDTYQRVGCYQEAISIWDSLYASNQFDGASVSIVFDACGYSGMFHTMQRIVSRLQRLHFVFNSRHWCNYIENLCRLGRIDEATKVLCVQIPEMTNMKPTVVMARTILQFAMKANTESLVLDRIQRYLPELYAKLI